MTAIVCTVMFCAPSEAVRSAPLLKNAANSSVQLASSVLSTCSATGILIRDTPRIQRRDSASALLSLSAGLPLAM